MRAPTKNEIDEFTEKLGIIPNASKGEISFKYILERYCTSLVNNKERPKMMALYIEATKYTSTHNDDNSELKKNIKGSERNLRCLIENLWKNPHTETFDEVFRYYRKKNKPTNLEFIGTCSSYLLHEVNKEDENIQKADVMQFEKEFLINKIEADVTKRLNGISNIPEEVKDYLNYTISSIIKDSIQDLIKYI